MTERVATKVHVAEIAKCQSLLPKEAHFAGRKGYYRHYRPDGSYEWGFKFRPNVRGRLTKIGGEVLECMLPFIKADTERHSRNEAKRHREKLRDASGGIRFVEPGLVDHTARRNGWSHVWRPRGVHVEAGLDGMLFRLVGSRWEATGVRCLGVPLFGEREVARSGIQCDPDGFPWRFVAGEWRRVI